VLLRLFGKITWGCNLGWVDPRISLTITWRCQILFVYARDI